MANTPAIINGTPEPVYHIEPAMIDNWTPSTSFDRTTNPQSIIVAPHGAIAKPPDITTSLASAAEGFPAWDVLDATHMLVASLIVDLVSDNDRPAFLRKMDRVLRDRVKEIGARQKPSLVI